MQNSVYSVSQLNTYIKNMFETDYLLKSLEVKGEISNLKYHSSGHIYFTLKDATSAIRCVMFKSHAVSLTFLLQDGMQVIIKGSCSVYERDGSYQLYVTGVKKEGIGDLFVKYEMLKEKLSELGMFDEMYKQPIPTFVKTLGVVTASTGAAIQDIIRVSKNRNPGIQIVLYPAIVQGPEAPESIIRGIHALEHYGVDVMIVGRGGGSIEDLWGFNDEHVAQAIFDCSVPIISAVGHETDFTIADFVADVRAATPSNAAELAVCDLSVQLKRLEGLSDDLYRFMIWHLDQRQERCRQLKRETELLSPVNRLKEKKGRLESLSDDLKEIIERRIEDARRDLELSRDSLTDNMENRLRDARHRLEVNAGKLHALSPLSKLSGGFSYVRHGNKPLLSVEELNVGDELSVTIKDGQVFAKTEKIVKRNI